MVTSSGYGAGWSGTSSPSVRGSVVADSAQARPSPGHEALHVRGPAQEGDVGADHEIGRGLGKGDEPGDNQVGVVGEGIRDQLRDEVTGEDIVAIHEADEGAARPIEAHVARRGRPLIALVNHRHPSIPLREVVADPGRGVAGSVVDDNDLEFAIGLCGNAVQALLKIRTHVVDGHDDAYQRVG